ncbi:hypothetical protein ACHAXT_000941 [Thalassiosira profunda]
MPTLPVSTTSPTADDGSDDDANSNYYSTSKPASTSTMVVMDVENIRGATSFRISHEALLSRIRGWREDRLSLAPTGHSQGDGASFLEPLVWICDHGARPSIHHFSMLAESEGEDDVQMPHNFGAVFVGPGRTADDVIVDLVGVRCGSGSYVASDDDDTIPQPVESSRNTTIVITADAGLISRCQEARRRSSSLSDVIFVEPASLLQQLERYRINAHEEEALFGEVPSLSKPTTSVSGRGTAIEERGKRRSDGKTSTMTSFKDSSIAASQHAKFQARFGNKKKSVDADAVKEEPSDNVDEDSSQTEHDAGDAALAAQLKTEQIRRQMLLSDAYYLARPSKNVRGRRAHTTQAAVHAKYKNRNISKKQQKKLYAKRFGRKWKEDMVHAAVRRKELAAKLQSNLRRTNCNSFEEEDTSFVGEGESGLFARSMNLLETLLMRFEEEQSIRGQSQASGDDIRPAAATSDSTTFLGIESTSGRIGTDDKWDPLGSTVNVPLREGVQDGDKNIAPLRLVVISDTHGFEGALSRFAEQEEVADDDSASPEHHHKMHSDDFLLPQADVLLHCGDFAASGSRKTQRMAARRLDEFLARQTHIPEKIVIQGNHDPDSPAKVIFPHSKALYVRTSSTLTINGVKVALEPFSRRMAFRSIRKRNTSSYAMPSTLPECDILVSHEPPKGVLDLTYHGFSAGSLYLRQLVEHAEHKPRLWLCGHIHESRGVITRQFQPSAVKDSGSEDAADPTTVINASNANSGRANRLVSGAVVVDIERCPSINGGEETAENTLVAQQVDYVDGFVANGSNGTPALAGLGEDLEVYQTRPGVRRRKGVPQSVRQQMKNARASLVLNGADNEE